MTIENEPCCTVPKGAKAADPSEAAPLAAAADRAFREGPILRLKLQGNRTLKITDCDDQDACEADRFRKHRLAAWWPALGYYVVNVGLYEDGMAYLISERDGRTTQLAALPVLSPSGHRAVALQSNLMAGVELDLVDMTADPPKVTEVTKCRPAPVPARIHSCGPSRSGSTIRACGSRESRRSPATIPRRSSFCGSATATTKWEC